MSIGFSPNQRRTALSRIDIIISALTVGLLALLAACASPAASAKAVRKHCSENLKWVGIAFKVWPPDSSSLFPMQRPKEMWGTKELIGTAQVFVHFRVLSNELTSPKMLVCPADKEKVVAGGFDSRFTDKNVSYFLGLDSTDDAPDSFLSGDRNFAANGQILGKGLFALTTNTSLSWTKAIHNSCGNILFSDGSVRQLDCLALAEGARKQGLATNLLALP